MKTKKVICLCLCMLVLCSLSLAACNNSEGATPDEASTSASSMQTESSTSTPATTAADTQATDTKENNDAESHDSQTVGGRPVDSDDADTGSSAPATITVGNKDHSVSIGKTFTYTYYLTTPKKIENVQASVTYDGNVLRIKETDYKEMFPVLGSSAVYNTNLEGNVKFNASNLSGIDFTQRGVLISLEFEVIKSGSTSVATALEYMDEKGGEPYVDLYKIVGDITCEEVLS